MRTWTAGLVIGLLLAGCASPTSNQHGGTRQEGGQNRFAGDSDGEGRTGGIVGVIVDAAIRPVANATVGLEGRTGNRTSADDGSFSFVGLEPGTYRLAASHAGYLPQQAVVEVVAGELAQPRIVLAQVAAVEPYNVTQKFDGFAQLTAEPTYGALALILVQLVTGESVCDRCRFPLNADAGITGLVVEATMASNSLPGGTNGFAYSFLRDGQWTSIGAEQPNPMSVHLKDLGGNASRFELNIFPTSSPAPEVNKAFQVFATLFYNANAPDGFSVIDDP